MPGEVYKHSYRSHQGLRCGSGVLGLESGLMGVRKWVRKDHLAEFNFCDGKVTMVNEDCLRQRKCMNRENEREKCGIFHGTVSPAGLNHKSTQVRRLVDLCGKVELGPDYQGPNHKWKNLDLFS